MHIRDGISLSLRKCVFPRASSLSSRNRRNSRAGEVPRSGIEKSHARERSTTRKMQKLKCGNGPPLGNRRILRAGTSQRQKITCFRALAPLSYFKNLIYLHSPQKNPLKKSYLIKSSFFRGKELKFVFIEKEELNL